ncbi:MAG: hypothetical protein IKM75_08605 [Bacteroidales bacterium]|nr:hypothetical protein [Bacteroidales bacterium]
MKKVLIIAFIFWFSNLAYSQEVFRPVLDVLTPMPAPVDRLYDPRPNGHNGYILLEENSFIPLQLYTNFQCTEFVLAEYNSITEPFVMMMMEIPDTDLKLYSVHVGGITEFAKTVLVLVNAEGLVLDTLEAEVCWGPPAMYAKQARIDKDYTITVYSIHAVTDSPLPINKSIPPFQGWREDVHYSIIDGRFVKTETIQYKKRIYEYADLTKDIWLCQEPQSD